MSKEIWKDVIGYEGSYQVSNLGRVKSVSREIFNRGVRQKIKERILKPCNKGGYLFVTLSQFGKPKTFAVHRLVAITFLPNPENKPQVNHLDENPLNNRLTNLAWATASENCNYGNRNKRVFKIGVVKPRSVSMYSIEGELLHSFSSIAEASIFLGKSPSCISACAGGKRKKAHGYIWKYT